MDQHIERLRGDAGLPPNADRPERGLGPERPAVDAYEGMRLSAVASTVVARRIDVDAAPVSLPPGTRDSAPLTISFGRLRKPPKSGTGSRSFEVA